MAEWSKENEGKQPPQTLSLLISSPPHLLIFLTPPLHRNSSSIRVHPDSLHGSTGPPGGGCNGYSQHPASYSHIMLQQQPGQADRGGSYGGTGSVDSRTFSKYSETSGTLRRTFFKHSNTEIAPSDPLLFRSKDSEGSDALQFPDGQWQADGGCLCSGERRNGNSRLLFSYHS